ncbi:MAG: hypothetical protein FJ100_16135 [Deltaproteobacteria bacterium]|nr:hypothetical protein [Deltaproteobacteria bacterium]
MFRLVFAASTAVAVACAMASCNTEIGAKAGAAVDDAQAAAKKKADAFATKIVNDALDDLACAGKISPTLAERLKAKISEKGGVTVTDLLSAPAVLSDVYARTTGSLAGMLTTLSAVRELLEVPAVKDVVAGGWDAGACGPAVQVPCLSGKAEATVTCANNKPTGIAVALTGCQLKGGPYSGAISLASVPTDIGAAEISFAALKLGESLQLDGKLRLKVNVGKDVSIDLRALSAITLATHQTAATKAKCGTKTVLKVAHLAADATQLVAEFDAERQNPDATYQVKTVGKHLFWPYSPACACPGPGAGIAVTFPAPYGKNAGPTLQVEFGAPTEADSCASVKTQLLNWPGCSKRDNPAADCGKASGEKLAAQVFAAVCGKGVQ